MPEIEVLEKTLENFIFNNKEKIQSKGLCLNDESIFFKNTSQQFKLPSGKIMDIFTWEITDGVFKGRIIELKKGEVKTCGYFQAVTYYAELHEKIGGYFTECNLDIVIIGDFICLDVLFASLTSNNIHLFVYDYNFEGLEFEYLNTSVNRLISDNKEGLIKEKEVTPLIQILTNNH